MLLTGISFALGVESMQNSTPKLSLQRWYNRKFNAMIYQENSEFGVVQG